ncbi:MAG: acyl-CoA dehydrogenase family protein [Rhodospirillaceae bacterium]|nr:acyl-CoA dehydrogenase family protein [Rhodospirillaceae bacterium]
MPAPTSCPKPNLELPVDGSTVTESVDEETFQSLLNVVERFTQDELIPAERLVEDTDEVPDNIIHAMRDLGLFGLSIPRVYGGLGLSLSQEARVMFELGRAASAFRSVIGTNVGIGSQGLIMDGTDAQKCEWLPRLAAGTAIASFALTEPDAGSDAASIRTSAKRDGDIYIISGSKRYITNAPRATVFTLMARTGPPGSGAAGISAFAVPAGTPGITLGAPDRKMGQRGTKTCDIYFDNVRVPANTLIGGVEGQGFKTAMKVLDRGRINIAASAIGAARRLIDESIAYASQRRQFNKPISEFQLVQAMIADSYTEYYAGKSMVMDAATVYDAQGAAPLQAASAKYFCTEAVGRIADRAVQIHGGAGYMAEYPVERIYRDVRLLRIYEGTSQIQQLVIAKRLLRDAAERTGQ